MAMPIDQLIRWALASRLLVIVATILVVLAGVEAWRNLRIDALPDLTNNQVQVFTNARGLAPVEVEKLVTAPIELAMQGLPDVEEVRSLSKFATSVVTIVFGDQVDPWFARQLVFERVQQARPQLPPGVGEPALGPMTSGMGEIYMYVLRGGAEHDLMGLRTLQDWVVKPQLRTVPGVTEVNSMGGEVKQVQVEIEPTKLVAHDLTLHQVLEALAQASSVAGGNYIEHNKEQYIVRGLGLAENLEDVRATVVATRHGVPIFVRDIAHVGLGPEVRLGAVTANGEGEVVSGIIMMLRGENSRAVIQGVKKKVAEVDAALPPGVHIEPFYDQTELVDKTIQTVWTNLLEGGLLVVAILFLFLRSVKAALLVAATIPLSMLFAFIGMRVFGLSANLMSLGAIDFGLMVDGAVVMVENAMRRMAQPENRGRDRRTVVAESAREVGKPIFFGVLIIVLVYLPILTLQGMEGRMFAPMALTVGCALLGSLLLALTLVPVLATWLLPHDAEQRREPVMERVAAWYEAMLRRAFGFPALVLGVSAAAFVASLVVLSAMGREFMPELDEGAITLQTVRLPSIALTETLLGQSELERMLLGFPEVTSVVSRTGRADIASDPMGPNATDVFVGLAPRETWRVWSKEELVEQMREKLAPLPGVNVSFTQPIAMRVDELVSGVKSDVAVKIFGDDLEVLARTGAQVAAAVRTVPGAREVSVEQVQGQTYLNIKIDRKALARYGSSVGHVQELIEAAIGGRAVGQVIEGQRRFDILVRLPAARRDTVEAIRDLMIDTADGGLVPLSQVARIALEEGPAQVSRERGQRRIVVEANLSGRDMGSFVAAAKAAIAERVTIPPAYFVQWSGQFEHQERAMGRLAVVVPIAIGLIAVLLYSAFRSIRQAVLIMGVLPLATVGGVLALQLRGLHLSVSAAIGFIALFGIAVLNGVVLVSTINRERQEGAAAADAAVNGAVTRLRPVLMTALVASFGFIPMALSTGAGAEIQRPLATVVIGGLVTATLLTLIVLPIAYAWLERGAEPPVPEPSGPADW